MRCASHPSGLRNNSVSINTFPLANDVCPTTFTLSVPVVGMLCGNAIAAVMVAQNFILKELELVCLLSPYFHLAERAPIPRGFSVKTAIRRRRYSRLAHHASKLVFRSR